MRLTLDKQNEFAREMLAQMGSELGDVLVEEILNADQSTRRASGSSASALRL
jgi:pyruvate-ferredoxin/flavodoxin oxidoreductase